jgi:uncharacterized protein YbjT (DUF2867 family)
MDSLLVAVDGSDMVFVAVGTTQKKVKGDQEAYRKVDVDIPVKLAKCCKETGCNVFAMVSAVGASARSGNFYLRIKGEAENAVSAAGVMSVTIVRPSLLLGTRAESRPLERFAKRAMAVASFLFPQNIGQSRPLGWQRP